MLLQCSVFLFGLAGLGFGPAKALFIFRAKGLQCRTHIVRLIAAKACFTHSTLLHKTGHINFRHGILPPPAPGSSTAKLLCSFAILRLGKRTLLSNIIPIPLVVCN